ncbi:MAG: hypothetical protein JXR81_05230 [Candidatus Goldbacteria bacterium]|nr:hypothetical protein [Candidatus Goldiibacteriota bacterium]
MATAKSPKVKVIPFYPHARYEAKKMHPWEKFTPEHARDMHVIHNTDKHHNKSGWRNY